MAWYVAREEAVGQRLLCDLEGEAAGAVADIEDHAAALGVSDPFQHPPRIVQHPVGPAVEGVGHHVPRPEHGHQVLQRGLRVTDVDHHEAADSLSGLKRPFQRFEVTVARHVSRQPGLDPQDPVAVLHPRLDSLLHAGPAQVLQLADRGRDLPHGGDVKQCEQPSLCRLEHVLTKRREGPGPRRARVQGRGHASCEARWVRLDPKLGHAPVDVDMKV